jgi:UDP-glucuronate decarboxylase
MPNKTKHALVTGGAGFLGSHLCKRLILDNYKVTCIDNLFSGSEENIKNLMKYEYFKFINHDITQPYFIEVDEIYNLACPASPAHYQHDPVRTIKTCVQGALNMLELAQKVNAKIFQASTSEIYGDPSVHPQNEQYWGNVNPIGLRSCYDEGKRCAETLFFDFNRQYKINIRVARIFNTYGPNMLPSDGRVVSNFIIQAINNKPITIYGDGSQTRSFCYVNDLIVGIILLMKKESILGPVNLGNPAELSMLSLANKIIELTKSKSEIIFQPLPQDDPKQRQPDISQAKKHLDWTPAIEINEGLQMTIYYFKKLLDSKSHSKLWIM